MAERDMWRRPRLTRRNALRAVGADQRSMTVVIGLLATFGLFAAGCGDPAEPAGEPSTAPTAPNVAGTSTPSGDPIPVVVDYSPTVSDVGALAYLATHPGVDLRAVTLAGTGESRCEFAVPNTIALLDRLGHERVPVACGAEEPVGFGHDWPGPWRDAADRLEPLDLGVVGASEVDGGAVELLIDTAASTDDLVIVALGPLTNLADAIEADPDFAGDVDRMYTMGGAIGVSGNAPKGAAEWNYYVDPTAVELVLRSGLPTTIVPLDATDALPANRGWYERIADASNPAARIVADLWSAARPWESGFFLWDELTAVLAVDPSLATMTDQDVSVVVEGADSGRTVVDPEGATVQVAAAPDRRAVEQELLNRITAG